MNSNNLQVSIVIPNFNGSAFIKNCISSVLGIDYPNFELILVDDGSTDDSIKLVKDFFGLDPRLKIIRHSKNLGLPSARNTGIRAAKGKYVAFLDVDTEVDSKWLTELINVLESDESIGVAMSKILDMYDRKRIHWTGQFIIPYTGWTVNRGYGEIDRGNYNKVEDVFACLNAAAVRREVFARVGLIDIEMPYWWEDIDFEWRVWLSGFREVLAPHSIVYHVAKPPFTREKIYRWKRIKVDYLSKGFFLFFLKNYEIKNIVKYLPWAISIYFFRGLLTLISKRDLSVLASTTKALFEHLKNLRHILRERYKIQRFIRQVSDDYLLQKFSVKGSLITIYRQYHLGNQRAFKKYFLPLVLSKESGINKKLLTSKKNQMQ